jgi:hypothetical protein
MTVRAALACGLALLVVSSGGIVLLNGGIATAAPDEIDDQETFTVRTGAIYPHLFEGGQICAQKIKPNVNRVVITNATLKDVDIYLGDDGTPQAHLSFPTGEVNGELILYTNGENLLVNTLATLGICLPPGIPNPLPTTLEAYYLGVENLHPKNLKVTSGGTVPEPSGPSLPKLLEATNTSREEIGLNTSTNVTNSTSNNTTVSGNNTTIRTPTNNTTIGTPTNNTTVTETPTNNTTIGTPTNNTTIGTPTNNTTVTETPTNNTTTTNTTNTTEPPSDVATTTVTTPTETNSTTTDTPGNESEATATPVSTTTAPTPTATPTTTPSTGTQTAVGTASDATNRTGTTSTQLTNTTKTAEKQASDSQSLLDIPSWLW